MKHNPTIGDPDVNSLELLAINVKGYKHQSHQNLNSPDFDSLDFDGQLQNALLNIFQCWKFMIIDVLVKILLKQDSVVISFFPAYIHTSYCDSVEDGVDEKRGWRRSKYWHIRSGSQKSIFIFSARYKPKSFKFGH